MSDPNTSTTGVNGGQASLPGGVSMAPDEPKGRWAATQADPAPVVAPSPRSLFDPEWMAERMVDDRAAILGLV